MKNKQVLSILLIICLIMITGCSDQHDDRDYPTDYPTSPGYSIGDLLLADSPGTAVMGGDSQQVYIDYSNVKLGYIRIKRLVNDGVKMKLQITNKDIQLPDNRTFPYYDLNKHGEYETFPLVYGNGNYTINIFRANKDKYMSIFTGQFQVTLASEQTPFLYPNQTVDYKADSKAILQAFELCKNDTNDLQRVKTLYDYVVNTITYDDDKAEATQNTYVLPVIDVTLQTKKGICFDYAALLAAMYRSQHIPCKVIVGNTKIEYHAWVEVWLTNEGWINPALLFGENAWTRMDPTFAASETEYDDYYETVYEY